MVRFWLISAYFGHTKFISSFSINELVRTGDTGYVFDNADELAEQLFDWFHEFPFKENHEREKIITNLKEFQKSRWQDNWDSIAWPIITKS